MKIGHLWRVVVVVCTIVLAAPVLAAATAPTFAGNWQTAGGEYYTCTQSSSGWVDCQGSYWADFSGQVDANNHLSGTWIYWATSNPNPPYHPCEIDLLSNTTWVGQFYEDQYMTYDTVTATRSGTAPAQDPQWKIRNRPCCADGSPVTFTLTIQNVTRSATNFGCNSGSAESDWATASAGNVTLYYDVTGACVYDSEGTLPDTLAKDQCYLFALEAESSSSYSINKYVADCPGTSSGSHSSSGTAAGNCSFDAEWHKTTGTDYVWDSILTYEYDGYVEGFFDGGWSLYDGGTVWFFGTRTGNSFDGVFGMDGDYSVAWDSGTLKMDMSSDCKTLSGKMRFYTLLADLDPYEWTFTATRE